MFYLNKCQNQKKNLLSTHTLRKQLSIVRYFDTTENQAIEKINFDMGNQFS